MLRIGREIQCLPYAGFFLCNHPTSFLLEGYFKVQRIEYMVKILQTILPVNANNVPSLFGQDFKNVALAKKGKASKTPSELSEETLGSTREEELISGHTVSTGEK